jgi:GH43 family beta-xylosidase
MKSFNLLSSIFKGTQPTYGQDPFLAKYQNEYLLCESVDEERIVISYFRNGKREESKIVWDAFGEHQVWAPELHMIDGLWYIYYSSSDGRNKTHRPRVIGAGMSPFGPYHFSETIDYVHWGIDMTVFAWKSLRYAIWSGWETNREDSPQNLYIAPLTSPVEIGKRTLLDIPTYNWERSIAPILEGPQVWIDYGTLYILYSANASWKPEYSTGILELAGENPLNPQDWIKCPWPLRANAGHGMIVDDMFIHHRKMSAIPGWYDREIISISKERFLHEGRFTEFKGKM